MSAQQHQSRFLLLNACDDGIEIDRRARREPQFQLDVASVVEHELTIDRIPQLLHRGHALDAELSAVQPHDPEGLTQGYALAFQYGFKTGGYRPVFAFLVPPGG